MVEVILRNLPGFKGKFRLGRLLFKNQIENAKEVVVKGKWQCEYILPNLKESIAWEIFVNGVYEKDTIEFIVDHVDKNGVFIDIGANVGPISIPVAKLRTDVRVIAIEAAPWIFQYLEKNIQKNGVRNITPMKCAIFNTENDKLPFYSPQDKFGKGSLAPLFTDNHVEVVTKTIDQLFRELKLSKIDLIKIDIEGFEYFAFSGAQKLFSQNNAPDILFEFIDWAEQKAGNILPGSAQEKLFEYGYKLFYLKKRELSGNLTESLKKGAHMIFATKDVSKYIKA